jgi:apolipoprotein N-acyltransferase
MPPDVLVNVTNDGWFWGTNILDLQLACAVCRAIENRLPVLIAANTGISAVIDSDGRILDRGPRRGESILYAEVQSDDRHSYYRRIGDIPAVLCALFCLSAAVFASVAGRRWNKWGSKGRY